MNNPKLRIKNFAFCIVVVFLSFFIAQFNCFAADQLTITTYYPSPYGVYKTLRVYPTTDAACAVGLACNKGEMCYSSLTDQLFVCGSTAQWAAMGGSGGYWTQTGSDLYPNDTAWNVGIGTSNPQRKLHVLENSLNAAALVGDEQLIIEANDAGMGIYSKNESSGSSHLDLVEINPDGSFSDFWALARMTNLSDGSFRIYHGTNPSWYAAAGNTAMLTIQKTGNVGIGTTSPNNTLQVKDLINFDNTKFSTYLGYSSGSSITAPSGDCNTGVGYYALRLTTIGRYNAALGYNVLANNVNGNQNTVVGYRAGEGITSGNDNVLIGFAAGFLVNSGNTNVIIGSAAGATLAPGGNNILIGEQVNVPAAGTNYYLNIGGKILGDLLNGRIGINGAPSATRTLYVTGDIAMSSAGGGGKTVFDIAEDIPAAKDVEPADVVVIDADTNQRVVKSTRPYDATVAGVISTSPAFLIDMKDSDTPLALAGRVPCKVTAENGPIKRGDLLVTSSKPGYAMKADLDKVKLGMIIGKALEPLNEKEGKVMVLLTK